MELFTDFLQKLTKVIQIGVTDPDSRWALIGYLAFENANLECKKLLGPLKVRSEHMDEWICIQ